MPPDDVGDKTEAPTQHKPYDSRQKGQVARSVDLSSAVILLGALLALNFMGPRMFGQLASMMARLLDGDGAGVAGQLYSSAPSPPNSAPPAFATASKP